MLYELKLKMLNAISWIRIWEVRGVKQPGRDGDV